jgi:sterol desaturase/sphingolipid hydroxylase (fatty acid hydroxylase superfamily)
MDPLQETVAALWNASFGTDSRLWPVYLLFTLLMAYGLFRLRRIEGTFLAWLVPRSVWTHASHVVDIKLFLLSRLLSVAGVFQVLAVATLLTQAVSGLFAPAVGPQAPPNPLLIAALLLIVGDFATYWVHRVHHELRILWPFHSVHHSAEVMTPITVYRKHPVYDLTKSVVHGLFLGVLQGVLVGLFPGGVSVAMLMGVNGGYFLFNMLGANFRHSHIRLGYGRFLEHVLISPAQHQIHHSIAPEHHNTNYGEVLALWDWMFGTLCLSSAQDHIEFGLGDAQGNRLAQRHYSLAAALTVPLLDSWKQLRKLLRRRRALPEPTVSRAK